MSDFRARVWLLHARYSYAEKRVRLAEFDRLSQLWVKARQTTPTTYCCMADEGRYAVETIQIDDIKARDDICMPCIHTPKSVAMSLAEFDQLSISSRLCVQSHETITPMCLMEDEHTVGAIQINHLKARGRIYKPGLLMPMKGIWLTKYSQLSISSQLRRQSHEQLTT